MGKMRFADMTTCTVQTEISYFLQKTGDKLHAT
jgi:hypothetical protein